jgi:hypothetical protein
MRLPVLLGISGWNNTKFSITIFHRKLHYHPIDIKKIKDSLTLHNFKP